MKMPLIKAAGGFQALRLFFSVFLFLICASDIYPVDQTNRFDFDGDGKADIAVYREGGNDRSSQAYSQSYWYYLKSSNGAFDGMQYGQTLDVPIPADYDGDGKTDPTVFRWFDPGIAPFDGNTIYLFGTFLQTSTTRGFGNAGGRKMARNFLTETGNAKAEIGEFQRANMSTPPALAKYKYTFYFQTPGGGLESKDTNYPVVPNDPWGTYEQVPVPDDYDGNGVSEIAVFEINARCYHVWPSNAQGSSSSPQECFNTGFSIPAPADYDGDGKADYAAVRITGSTVDWQIRPSGGGADLTPQIQLATSAAPIKPVVADYDGDGRADLAVAQVVSGTWQWTIHKTNCFAPGKNPCAGVTPVVTVTNFGFGTDILIPSPYFYDRWY